MDNGTHVLIKNLYTNVFSIKIMQVSVLDELKAIVGDEFATNDPIIRWTYSMDSNIFDLINPSPPLYVVRPKSNEEVQKIIKFANKIKIPIYVQGAGTNDAGARGEKIKESILIDMTRMNDVLEIDEESLTVTVQAGITWGKLNAELEKKGWRLGFKGTYSGYAATVGGGIANNSNGMGSAKYGVLGEEVISLTVVLPNGEILKTGTAINPYAKRYYRYAIGPDITGLFIGSLGAFGVITEATLRIYPKAEFSEFGAYAFKKYDDAQKCYYEWLKYEVAEDIAWYAEDGLYVMLPELYDAGYVSLLTYVVEDTTQNLVNARKELLDRIAVENNGEPQDKKYAEEGWKYKFELLPRWAGKIGAWQWLCHLNSAGGSLKDLLSILNYVNSRKNECKHLKIYTATVSIAHKNAGHVSTSLYFDQTNPEAIKVAKEMSEDIVKIAIKNGGCNYKPGKLWYKDTILRNRVYHQMLLEIKKSLDPNYIMNPGALALNLER
jgi:FAD/FMN-containing dehydrogenase